MRKRRDSQQPSLDLPEPVVRALRSGQKIHAIKLLRDATGMGLADAKHIIEQATINHPEMVGRRMISEPREERAGLRFFVVLVVIALISYYLFFRAS